MSHAARDSMAAVRNLFPNHVISRYGDITRPARSPDLSACDFFFWGYLKSQVSKRQHPTQFRRWNIEFSKKSNEFLWRCFKEQWVTFA